MESIRARRPGYLLFAVVLASVMTGCGGKVAVVDGSGESGSGAPGESGGGSASGSGSGGSSGEEPPRDPAPAPPAPPPSEDCATFGNVLTVLVRNGCSSSACHGEGAVPPLIDPARPLATQRGFYDFRLSSGMPYVDLGGLDPSTSGMSCNVRGTCGVAMPPGDALSPAEAEVIDRWLSCGARL